jgi:hypothetical protein
MVVPGTIPPDHVEGSLQFPSAWVVYVWAIPAKARITPKKPRCASFFKRIVKNFLSTDVFIVLF